MFPFEARSRWKLEEGAAAAEAGAADDRNPPVQSHSPLGATMLNKYRNTGVSFPPFISLLCFSSKLQSPK